MTEITSQEGLLLPTDNGLTLDQSNVKFAALPTERQELFLRYNQERLQVLGTVSDIIKSGKDAATHGTSSNFLPSILQTGLGAIMPDAARAKSRSTTDASKPGGILGAYLFAKGLMGDKLAIRREEIDPEGDALARYTHIVPIIKEDSLRKQVTFYFEDRRQRVGASYDEAYPVFFLLGAQPGQMIHTNPAVPSECVFTVPFRQDQISGIYVPESNISQTQELIDQMKLPIPLQAQAIEPLELL